MRLVILNALLIATVSSEFLALQGAAAPGAGSEALEAPAQAVVAAPVPPTPAVSDLDVLERQPIFFAGRSAPEPTALVAEEAAKDEAPEEAVPEETDPPAPLTLLGTVVSEGVALAIVENAGESPSRAFPGDIVGGWEIVDILPNEVVLSHGGGTRHVELTRASSAREGRPVQRNYGSRGLSRGGAASGAGAANPGAKASPAKRGRTAAGRPANGRAGATVSAAAPAGTASAQAWAAAAARRGAAATGADPGDAGAGGAGSAGAGATSADGGTGGAGGEQTAPAPGPAAVNRGGPIPSGASEQPVPLPADDLSLNIIERFDDDD